MQLELWKVPHELKERHLDEFLDGSVNRTLLLPDYLRGQFTYTWLWLRVVVATTESIDETHLLELFL